MNLVGIVRLMLNLAVTALSRLRELCSTLSVFCVCKVGVEPFFVRPPCSVTFLKQEKKLSCYIKWNV